MFRTYHTSLEPGKPQTGVESWVNINPSFTHLNLLNIMSFCSFHKWWKDLRLVDGRTEDVGIKLSVWVPGGHPSWSSYCVTPGTGHWPGWPLAVTQLSRRQSVTLVWSWSSLCSRQPEQEQRHPADRGTVSQLELQMNHQWSFHNHREGPELGLLLVDRA